jgi:hypothetical protein
MEANMKPTTWDTSPTVVMSVGGQDVAVARLPQDIQFDIKTWDRMRQDLSDLLYEKEKLECALQTKERQIQQQVAVILNPATTTTTATPKGNDNGPSKSKKPSPSVSESGG